MWLSVLPAEKVAVLALGAVGKSGARLVETTPERHDEIMALVQGINHLDTLVMEWS